MASPYTWLWRDVLKLKKPLTHYAQEWIDANPALYGLLVGAWASFLTWLILRGWDIVGWVLVSSSSLLYAHFLWGGFVYTLRRRR